MSTDTEGPGVGGRGTAAAEPGNAFETLETGVVLAATSDNFEAMVLRSPVHVVLDFYAPWCQPCRALTPTLERLAAEFAGQVRVVKINTDEEAKLSERYRITALPTLILFQDGEEVGRRVGSVTPDDLRTAIERLIPLVPSNRD